jgi:hypothetical protein
LLSSIRGSKYSNIAYVWLVFVVRDDV